MSAFLYIPIYIICLVNSVTSDSLQYFGLEPTKLLYPWDSLGENTGVGCHFLLQGIVSTQGSNSCVLCLLYWRQILYPLSYQENPICIKHILYILCNITYTIYIIFILLYAYVIYNVLLYTLYILYIYIYAHIYYFYTFFIVYFFLRPNDPNL